MTRSRSILFLSLVVLAVCQATFPQPLGVAVLAGVMMVTAVLLWRPAVRDADQKLPWRCASLAAGLWGAAEVGAILRSTAVLAVPPVLPPSCGVAAGILLLVAAYSLGRRKGESLRVATSIDGALVALGAGALLWTTTAGLALPSVGSFPSQSGAAGALCLTLLAGPALPRLVRTVSKRGPALWFLCGAFGLQLLMGILVAVWARLGLAVSGGLLSVGGAMAFVLLAYGAHRQVDDELVAAPWPVAAERYKRTIGLAALVLGVPTFAAVAFTSSVAAIAPFLAPATAMVVCLVVYRVARALRKLEHDRAELAILASTDRLTGLANRVEFDRRMARVELTDSLSNPFGLVCIDLDGFKAINDELGHHAGDQVLQVVGTRLRLAVREEDLVARLGGDEFMILLEQADPDRLADVAERVVTMVREPILLSAGVERAVSASVGAVLSSSAPNSPADLIRQADRAMYAAKLGGKNNWRTVSAAPKTPTRSVAGLLTKPKSAGGVAVR